MSKFRVIGLLVGILLLHSFGSAHAQNLIQNPSFENPVRTSSYTLLHTGDDIGGVWFVTFHASDVGHVRHAPSFPEPYPDGDQMIYVGDSGDAGIVAQPISTPLPAGSYPLSFSQGVLNVNQVAEARIQLVPITGGSGFGTTYGAPVYDRLYTLGGPAVPPGWYPQSDTITVTTSGSYGLLIIGAQDGLPTLVDNVSLVPEPASAALMALVAGLMLRPPAHRSTRRSKC
jgi:hypothetical protein